MSEKLEIKEKRLDKEFYLDESVLKMKTRTEIKIEIQRDNNMLMSFLIFSDDKYENDIKYITTEMITEKANELTEKTTTDAENKLEKIKAIFNTLEQQGFSFNGWI